MAVLDLSGNCVVNNNTFQQDLVSYSVSNEAILWSDNSTSSYSIGNINGQSVFDGIATTGYWTPYIIDSDAQVSYKAISHYGSFSNNKDFRTNRLGIEDFITFSPKFKNWSVSGNSVMTIDWILNRPRSQYAVYGGISCWGKIMPRKTGKINQFPVYSKLDYNNNTYVKVDTNILKRIGDDVGSYSFSPNSISFNYDNSGFVELSGTPSQPNGPTIDTIFSLNGSEQKVLWVPDGDQIFYYYNNVEKESNLRQDIGPRSYVSSALYQYYINIYNALTINEKLVNVRDNRSLRKQRLYKKLAHALATSPFISEFFINYFLNPSSTVSNAINQYLDSLSGSISSDISNLNSLLVIIATELIDYEVSSSNNIIQNNAQLFEKFISKYGAKLKLTGNSSLVYSTPLKYGDSILFNEIGDAFVDKNLSDTTIIDNKIVRVGQLSYETNFSNQDSTILLKVNNETKNTIYLYNHIKPKVIRTTDPKYDFRGFSIPNGSSLGIVLNTNYIDGINNTPRSLEDAGGGGTTSYRPSQWEGSGSVLYWNFRADKRNVFGSDGSILRTEIVNPRIGIYPRLRVLDLYIDPKLTSVDTIQYGRGRNIYNLIINQFACQWEIIEGPADARFVDLNKKPNLNQSVSQFDIANDLAFFSADEDSPNNEFNRSRTPRTQGIGKTGNGPEVIFIPKGTGKYTIKCTVNSPYGSFVLYRTIFVVVGDPSSILYGRYFEPNIDIDKNDTNNLLDLDTLFMTQYGYFGYLGNTIPEDIFILVTEDMIMQNSIQNRRIPLNSDNLEIHSANLGSYAIHRNGLFTGIDSEYYIETVYQNERPLEKLSNNNFQFLFSETEPIEPRTQSSNFSIDYLLNNSIIKLDRIILENIRQDNSECSQCYSLYEPKFRSYITKKNFADTGRTIFERSKKYPDIFTVQKYNYNTEINVASTDTFVDYSYPKISTDIAPPIKTYGGYGHSVLDTIGFTGIPYHDKPPTTSDNMGVVANNGVALPPLTGHMLNNEDDFLGQMTRDPLGGGRIGYKFCYQKHIDPTGNYVEFSKGVFNPNSGWIVNSNDNLSNVLKFNPGARSSYSFTGPGIERLTCFSSTTGIKGNVFSSTVELGINPYIVWDPGPRVVGDDKCCGNKDLVECFAEARAAYWWGNDGALELGDQFQPTVRDEANGGYHYGYRILNGGLPKFAQPNYQTQEPPPNDEFLLSTDKIQNKYLYSFNVIGPNKKIEPRPAIMDTFGKPLSEASPENRAAAISYVNNPNRWSLRDPRINFLAIEDIEVKLNFLNYVNTKNLVVWLEVEFCAAEKSEVAPITDEGRTPRSRSPITSFDSFIDQVIDPKTYLEEYLSGHNEEFPLSKDINIGNDDFNRFLLDLTNYNAVSGTHTKLKLFLLNQETIQNQKYNFSVTFSDTANKNNTFFDSNSYAGSKINPDQNIIHNNQKHKPTTFAPNYSTKENSYYRKLIEFHKLNITNNNFSKFAGKQLFGGLLNEQAKCSPLFSIKNSSTKFTLKLAVLDEEDEMYPLDTIINNELFSGLDSVYNKLSTSNIFNNLCSWELILHTDKVKKPSVSNVSGPDNYGATDAMSLIEYGDDPKYPGYSFIADLTGKEFLLPYVNINAPTTFMQNVSLCGYLSQDNLVSSQPLISSPRFPSEAILAITVSRVGAMELGRGGPYGQLTDWFSASAAVYNLLFAQREIYDIEYDGYPMGSSDKVLLNVSEDGCFWYKLEASIFRLDNTPALPLKKYKFYKGSDDLFKFDFNIVTQNRDLIDDTLVPYIINQELCTDTSTEGCDINQVSSVDLLNNNNFILHNKVLTFNNVFRYLNDSNYQIITIDNSIPYDLYGINDLVSLTQCNAEDGSSIPDIPIYVVAKALIYKDNVYKTVLVLYKGSSTISCGQIYVPDNIFVVYDGNNTRNSSSKFSPISDFGLVADNLYKSTLYNGFSTNSVGSYGDGSTVRNKNVLSEFTTLHSIKPLYDILNNHINDKFNYNEMNLDISTSGLATSGMVINSKFQAYPCYYDTQYGLSENNKFYHIYDKNYPTIPTETDLTEQQAEDMLDNIGTFPKDNKTYSKDKKYNIIYIKVESNRIKNLPRNTNGFITIENSYTYNDTIEKITNEEFTLLTNRLNTLNIEKNEDIEKLIGNRSRTNTILNSNSIVLIQNHYDAIEDDPANCSAGLCYKKITLQKLNKLYTERNDIIKLLEDQAIRKVRIHTREGAAAIEGEIVYDNFDTNQIKLDNDMVFNKDNLFKLEYFYIMNPAKDIYIGNSGGILSAKKAIITANRDNSIDIKYESLTQNKYWINIDPKQSCSIAEELRPRVLLATYYRVDLANPPAETRRSLNANNNISPDFLSPLNFGGVIKMYSLPTFSFAYVETGASFSPLGESMVRRGKLLSKEFIDIDPTGPIAAKKRALEQQFPGKIMEWKEKIVSRSFRIHNDTSINGVYDDNEFIIRCIELYDVATNSLDSDLTNQELLEQGFVQNDFSADVSGGLLNGLSSDGRYRRPTRVYNIFNMNNLQNLKVQFRKVPRMLRGIDLAGTVLRYGSNTTYRPNSVVPAEAPDDIFSLANLNQASLINNLYCWHCYQLDPNTYSVVEATTPPMFQYMNEMWFRAFYGSVDNVEIKSKVMKSYYDWEAIPFEYFTNPPPATEE